MNDDHPLNVGFSHLTYILYLAEKQKFSLDTFHLRGLDWAIKSVKKQIGKANEAVCLFECEDDYNNIKD